MLLMVFMSENQETFEENIDRTGKCHEDWKGIAYSESVKIFLQAIKQCTYRVHLSSVSSVALVCAFFGTPYNLEICVTVGFRRSN